MPCHELQIIYSHLQTNHVLELIICTILQLVSNKLPSVSTRMIQFGKSQATDVRNIPVRKLLSFFA